MTDANDKVRLDKWLWAARFFKTRSLAKHAIEGGKVYCDGQRVKVSKELRVGAIIRLRQGYDEKTVVVAALSDKRGNATIAQSLYNETPESLANRERRAAERKVGNCQGIIATERPSKRDRRILEKFKQKTLYEE